MAENFYTILTEIGKAKLANSQVTGVKVDLTQMAVGDGNGSYYNPTDSQTTLVNEVWRGNIGSIDIDSDNPSWIVIETVIPADDGGFNVREAGIFDSAGDMIAIGKYPDTYKPILEEGSAKDLYIRMIIEVSNASSVTLKIDPAVTIASRKYVDDKVSNLAGDGRTTETVKGNKEALETHLAETISQRIFITRDATLTGVQSISTKRKANHLNAYAMVQSTNKYSIGSYSLNDNSQNAFVLGQGIINQINTGLISIADTTTNRTVGTVQNVIASGFEINWSHINTGGTGTISIILDVLYHGEA